MCGGRKAARSAAAIGERREIERGEAKRRKQQKLHIEMPQHAVARVGAVGDDELHDEEAHRHEQRGRRKRTGAPLGDERVEHCRAGAGEEHGKDQLQPRHSPAHEPQRRGGQQQKAAQDRSGQRELTVKAENTAEVRRDHIPRGQPARRKQEHDRRRGQHGGQVREAAGRQTGRVIIVFQLQKPRGGRGKEKKDRRKTVGGLHTGHRPFR